MLHESIAIRRESVAEFSVGTMFAAVIAAFAGIPHAHAQAQTVAAATLPDVTVTVGRGSNLEKMDLSTTVITHEEVQASPETSVEQILNKIPGIWAPQVPSTQVHPTGAAFSMRGFGQTTSITTLVMVDGIPVNDPYFRVPDWSQMPKDSIERIEIVRGGGATSLWGNLAMGGIINIITREPSINEKSINASYGSFNTKTLDTTLGLFASDKLKVGLTVGGSKSDGYNLTPAQFRSPYMSQTGSQVLNMTLAAYFTPSADSKYYLKAYGHDAHEQGLTWYDAGNNWNKYQISGGGTTKLSGSSSINVAGWYNNGEMDTTNASQSPAYNINNPSLAVPYISQVEQAKYKSAGGSAFYQKDFGVIKDVKFGVDARGINSNDSLNIYSTTANTASVIAKGQHRFQGLFVQGTWSPQNLPMDVTLGLRENFFQTSGASFAGIVKGAPVSNTPADATYTHFDPRIGAKYYLANGFDLRAAAYGNFAAPGMNQMYRSFVSGTSYTATNSALAPQTNTGQEIGIDFKRSGVDVAATLFYNNVHNFIDFSTICSGAGCAANPLVTAAGLGGAGITTVSQYTNAGDAVIKGAELLGTWQTTETVQLNGGFVRTIAYLTTSPYATLPTAAAPADPINSQIGQVPNWMASLGSNWQATSQLKLTAVVKTFPAYWVDTGHTTLASQGTIADVGFIYKFDKRIDIYGGAQNLFNRNYYNSGFKYTAMNGVGGVLNSGTAPVLGMPLNVTVGLRASF